MITSIIISLLCYFTLPHLSNQHILTPYQSQYNHQSEKASDHLFHDINESNRNRKDQERLIDPHEQNRSYLCSLVSYKNKWACSLQGVMIAQDFFLHDQSNINISSYPYQAINEVTIFESFENNIIVPFKYFPFFMEHYYNSFNCSIMENNDDTQLECEVVDDKQFPPVLFLIQDFGISFEEFYSTYFKSIKSKFVFRKGIKHWILGNELIKKYTVAFNPATNSISFSSKNNNDIIPFKWTQDTLYYSKFNMYIYLSVLLLIGLCLIIFIKHSIKESQHEKSSVIIKKGIEKRLIDL